jgi:D-serine deaminase-like pyridoxal phosphate-dependent protein
MTRNTDKQARVEAMLGELAELSLGVARELAVRLRESEDTDETVALAGAFQKMSRVVRLTLALDAKLEREAARDAAAEAKAALEAKAEAEHEAAEAAYEARAAEPAGPVEARKARVRGLMNRLLWNESEGEEEDYEVLVEDLNARLDEAALSPDFEDLPIETVARRVIADMGLSGRFALSLGEARPAPARELQAADTG